MQHEMTPTNPMPSPYSDWQRVEFRIDRQTDLGYAVWVNDLHEGLLYANCVPEPLRVGQNAVGYIVKVRPDGKLDLSMYPQGRGKVEEAVDTILHQLSFRQGFLALHDGSSPEEIYAMLGISKRNFKQALGYLFRQRKVLLEPEGTRLVKG